MKPAAFAYHRPATVDEAVALLAELGSDAKPLAGGQSLIPAMNFRLTRPTALVDLNRLAELAAIRSTPDDLRLGAMVRQRTVERSEDVRRAAPLLSEALPFVAHAQIRNRGTVGGSIAHADPAAELPAVMLALGARFRVRGQAAERWIPAEAFFTGLFATALAPDELLTEIAIPALGPRTGCAFAEIARRHGDYALAGVAAVLRLDDGGRCTSARIALFSVGDGPVLAARAAAALIGETPSDAAIRAAAEAAAVEDIDPPSDIHARAAYRRQLVRVLTLRLLPRAVERARPTTPE